MGSPRLKAYRIGAGEHPVFQGEGARRNGARWNSPGRPVIYCGHSFAIAMLERLVYSAIGTVPTSDRYVVALVPEDLIEALDESTIPGWRQAGSRSARDAGDRWLARGSSAALSVPSAVTGIDRNLLLNPAHPQFGQITVGEELPVAWDRRLFGRPTI